MRAREALRALAIGALASCGASPPRPADAEVCEWHALPHLFLFSCGSVELDPSYEPSLDDLARRVRGVRSVRLSGHRSVAEPSGTEIGAARAAHVAAALGTRGIPTSAIEVEDLGASAPRGEDGARPCRRDEAPLASARVSVAYQRCAPRGR